METPGRYRRAFNWRFNPADQDDTMAATGGLVSLFRSELPEVLEDYLQISRKRRHNRLALARLQSHLIDEIITVAATVSHYRDRKSHLEAAGNERQNEGNPPELQEELKIVCRELFLWRAFANVVRSIADGVAWRALGYDRAVLRALCQNRGSQHITSPGAAEELREWSRQFDQGEGVAILNSLTNWLTHGDITVVRDDGSVEVIEEKSSKTTSNRTVRQKQRMRELVTFLSTGKGQLEGKTVQVGTLDIFPHNGLSALRELLEATNSPPGYAAARISNSTYIECVDFRVVEKGAETGLIAQRDSMVADWIENDDDIHQSRSFDCLGFGPNLAPLSVFPFEPKVCIDLLTGAKAYFVLLNVTGVARQFEHRGWQIVTTPQQVFENSGNFDEDFMTVRKEGFTATVPPAAFMRMQMELL